MGYEILLVEDDLALCEVIKDYLCAKGMEVTEVHSGEEAEQKLWEKGFDLVLLDIMLPGMDGFSFCRELRKKSDVPVIFLTARGMEEDKLRGYALGGDDYLVKPFSLAVLYAKSTVLIRRSKGLVASENLTVGELTLDPTAQMVTLSGQWLPLTKKEYCLLKVLLERKNQTVSRDTLLYLVWGGDFEGSDRVVDNHIRKLRKKLGKQAGVIRTMVGMGYRLEG